MMNRSTNSIGELTKRMLTSSAFWSAFLFVFAMSDVSGGQSLARAQDDEAKPGRSSRRLDSDNLPPVQDTDAEEKVEDDFRLDGSDDVDSEMDDDSDDPDADIATDEENDESKEDPDDDLENTDELKDHRTGINTDTRFLRVNIAETSEEAPSDQSYELVSQDLGTTAELPSEKLFAWAAPDIHYQPLYFEDVALERYGQTPEGCELRQTVLSAAHFFGSAALLPYKLVDQHRHSCDSPLGFCRPGSDTPFVRQRHLVR